jgi:hypothetical protein
MVSIAHAPRDSLRETLQLWPGPQRWGTTPATVLTIPAPQVRIDGVTSLRLGVTSLRPNPSLELTHYGMPRKPAVRQFVYRHTSGLRAMPPRSAQLER